jgi:hypothetical protein
MVGFSYRSACQSNDTLSVEVISIKNLREFYLIGVVSSSKATDTIVLISDIKNIINKRKREKIQVGKRYTLAIEKEIVVASPPKKMWFEFKNIVVWTSKESYRLMPRFCLNCSEKYISSLYRK